MLRLFALVILASTYAAPLGFPAAPAVNTTTGENDPTGTFEGSVPFIIDVTMGFSGNVVNAEINVKVAHQDIKCPGEPFAFSGGTVTFPNITKTGDCMGDALRGKKKDVTKFLLTSNSDGSLTFHSDGWPNLKLKKQ